MNCRAVIEKMLKKSQTKVIFPVLALGLVQAYKESTQTKFSDSEIRGIYESTVNALIVTFGHDLHIGGKYYDAYSSRNLTAYKVLIPLGDKTYRLAEDYQQQAGELIRWIPEAIKSHITQKLGMIPNLGERNFRFNTSENRRKFIALVTNQIDKNPSNFEIFSFAILKVHLEKFACKIYRDTRTSASDKGVDLSTNFGVVYQIKKLKLLNTNAADRVYTELRQNFDNDRLNDGNVIVVIDDISSDVKRYLINMKVQSISKDEIIKLARQIDDLEDREKLLRIVYDEFCREYKSVL